MDGNRRSFVKGALGAALAPLVAPLASAQDSIFAEPRDWSGQTPIPYPDPDVLRLDDRFAPYIPFNTGIQRLYNGTLWAEGPAWNGVGRYLVWSDIPNNVQMRWIEDDRRVTVFP